MKQILSLGRSTFATLRYESRLYVDKTDLICKLCRDRCQVLFTRPRCFGKTLTLSTIDSLFSKGLEEFKGLAIEKHWSDTTYDVVSLDFSSLKFFMDLDSFRRGLVSLLVSSFQSLGFVYQGHSLLSCVDNHRFWLKKRSKSSLVLLIDEYDTPLTSQLDSGKVQDIARELELFYGVLSECSDVFRFALVIGVTQLKDFCLFNVFPDLKDVTYDDRFSTLVGFTDKEIIENFSGHLDVAAQITGMNTNELTACLVDLYGGYRFSHSSDTCVVNPWSLLNFLDDPQSGFAPYWVASAGNTRNLYKFIERSELSQPLSFFKKKLLSTEQIKCAGINDDGEVLALLIQAGYLTIEGGWETGKISVSFPNNEIKVSVAMLLADELLGGQRWQASNRQNAIDIIRTGTVDEIKQLFRETLESLHQQGKVVTAVSEQCTIIGLLLTASVGFQKNLNLKPPFLEVIVDNRTLCLNLS